MGYMEKWPSILLKDNRHEVKIWVLKDNRSEGQHHGIEEILLKGNCYFIEVADIKEERHLGRNVGQRCPNRVDRDAKSLGGRGSGGPHQRLSRRTELAGVPLASAEDLLHRGLGFCCLYRHRC